jgi:large subunit ribosomal protein L29
MKAKELREMTNEELQVKLRELKDELFQLRLAKAQNKLGNPHQFGMVKKDIARILTILRERELEAES